MPFLFKKSFYECLISIQKFFLLLPKPRTYFHELTLKAESFECYSLKPKYPLMPQLTWTDALDTRQCYETEMLSCGVPRTSSNDKIKGEKVSKVCFRPYLRHLSLTADHRIELQGSKNRRNNGFIKRQIESKFLSRRQSKTFSDISGCICCCCCST